MCHSILVYNFEKCWSILKILSLLDSAVNLQQGCCHISHCTLNLSLHYLVKYTILTNSNTLDVFNTISTIIDLLVNIRTYWITLNVQNALFWYECTPRDVCATHPLCRRWHFIQSHTRLSSFHQRHELAVCREYFFACIDTKGGHFSV